MNTLMSLSNDSLSGDGAPMLNDSPWTRNG